MVINDYTYRSMISSVSNAAAISELTSFEELNDDLDISLNQLYISLRDPINHEATDRIIQINNDTFFNTKEE